MTTEKKYDSDALKKKTKKYTFYPAKDSAIGDYPVQIWTEDATGKKSNIWTGKLTVSKIDYIKGKSRRIEVDGIQVKSDFADIIGMRYFPKEASEYGIIDFSNGKSPYVLNAATIQCIETVRKTLFGSGKTGTIQALWGEYYLTSYPQKILKVIETMKLGRLGDSMKA